MTQFLTAFGAGLLSFFSPCILPLLPAYLSLLSGFSAAEIIHEQGRVSVRQVAGRAAVFIAGFTLAFSLLGAAASELGALLDAHKQLMMKVFGVLLVLFGLHMTELIRIGALNYERRFSLKRLAGGAWGAFLMGFAFALGWSPCIGPILGAILGLAATEGKATKGVALLMCYSAGLAVPLMAAALLTAEFFAFIARFKAAMRRVEVGAGAVMVVCGVLLFFDKLMFVG